MLIIYLILILIILILFGIILYARQNYGTLENSGFPVLKPTFCLGSVPNLHNEIQHLEDIKRHREYGPVLGIYEGQSPQVHVSDPELIRLILVKDFDYFHNRREIDFGSPTMNEILDYLPGEKWRTVRTLLTPLFTTAKLKTMSSTIANNAKEFAQDIKIECQGLQNLKFDCNKRLSTWLVDMFSRTIMGIQMDNCKDVDNEFMTALRKLVGEDIIYSRLYSLTKTFPFLTMFAPSFDENPIAILDQTIRHILKSRRTINNTIKKPNDFVELLNELWSKVDEPDFKRLGIFHKTIIAQAINFYLGGYETTTNTLTHLFYYLCKNPNILSKLQNEIDTTYTKYNHEFNNESIREENSPYLSACINEALRLAPSFFRPERICTKDWIHNGIHIKKGTSVMITTWASNRNPMDFPNPNDFEPERFLPENKHNMNPYAFSTFGHGPRNCIGMRFAYESMKLFTSYFFHSFSIQIRNDSVLNYKPGSLLLVAFNEPLYVDVIPRIIN